MADEWSDPAAAAIMAASAKAGLTGRKAAEAAGIAALFSRHNQLSSLPVEDARKRFAKLDISLQDSLKQQFGEMEYSTPEPGFLGKTANIIKKPFEWAADGLTNYEQAVSSPYRAARQATSFTDFVSKLSPTNDFWKTGERQFDPEREQIVDNAYDPNIVKIAKRIAIGDKPSVIAADMETPEEMAAYDKLIRGDEDMLNAIRDYNDAKVSPGRDWARVIGLEPNVGQTDQGLEGTLYKLISGTVDVAAGLAMDPAVAIGATFSATRQARYGVMSMLAAKNGDFTRVQKMLMSVSRGAAKVTGGRIAPIVFGVEAAFSIPKVRQAFDALGPMLEKVGSAKSTLAEKSMAMDAIRTQMPNMTDRAIIYMAQNEVRDADSAMKFFKESDLAEDIMMGRVGSMQAVLPTYTVSNRLRSALRRATQKGLGEAGTAAKTAGREDDLLNELMAEGSVVQMFDIKQTKMNRDKFARIVDRALLRNYVNVEGDGVIDSAADVYSLARTFLGRPQARLVSNAFALAPDAASRRQIIVGLYGNLGEYLGVKSTQAGAKAWDAELDVLKNAKYSNDMTVDPRTARAIGVKSGSYDPSMVAGRSVATSVNQATERMSLPQLQDLLKLQEKGMTLRSIGPAVNSAAVQKITDYWSALNLLPRLGIRSVLDETLFHSLTLPVMLFPTVVKGYVFGVTSRIVRGGQKRTTVNLQDKFGERDIGIVARVFSKWFADVDEKTLRAALSSRKAQADLIQEQVTKSRFGRVMKFSKNFQADAKYISDLNRYSLTRNLDDFSAGAAAGIVNSLPTNRIFDEYSEYANLNIDAAMDDLGKKFGDEKLKEISFTEPEFAVNVLMQLAFRVDGNGEIGKIAVRYMDRPKKAVLEIKKYLQTPEGKAVYNRFDRSRLPGRSIDMDAKDFYLNVRGMFVDDAGELNTALLGKVRRTDKKGNELISTTDLTVDDLGEAAVAKMLPRRTLGYAFRVPGPKQYFNSLIDRGFQIADRQLGTLSRTPVYNAYYLGYRRQFAQFEKNYINKLMKTPGMTRTAAENMAARRYAELADNMAINRAIGFVDNPNIRSFAAYEIRNLARYYRATENFWVRATRVAANTPQALVRLRLASETVDHAGFIQEDENGDKYFVFPADTIMYGLSALPIKLITGDWPKQPSPMSITGKVKMLTPSLDPDSALPTFSGPLSSVIFSGISTGLGFVPGGAAAADSIDTVLLGKYAENQGLMDMIQPMLFRRGTVLWDVLTKDEQNSQFISAAMKSAAMYSADPKYNMPDATSNMTDIAEAKYDIRATAFNIIFLRAVLGVFAPVSPQLTWDKDVPEWMRDAGVKNFKNEFSQILSREYEKGTENAEMVALNKFTRLYPGKLAYTVPETELTTVGSIRNTKQAVEWIQKNNNLVRMFPQGSVFLMPQMNQTDLDSYMFLRKEGYGRKSKELEDFLNQIATVKEENEYYDIKNEAEKLAASEISYGRAQAIMAEADARASAFLKDRPYLQLQMMDGGRGTVLKRMALDDARNMLASPEAPRTSTANLLRKMIETYDNAKASLDNVTAQTDEAISYRRTLRQSASNELRTMAGTNPNALEFYDTILKRLIEK